MCPLCPGVLSMVPRNFFLKINFFKKTTRVPATIVTLDCCYIEFSIICFAILLLSKYAEMYNL